MSARDLLRRHLHNLLGGRSRGKALTWFVLNGLDGTSDAVLKLSRERLLIIFAEIISLKLSSLILVSG